MIETNAITSGTNASSEAKTKREHEQRAQRRRSPPRAARPGPPSAAAVLRERVEAGQVHGLAAHLGALERRLRGPLGPRVLAERRVGVGRRIDERERRCGRPSRRTRSSPVEAYEAIRAPGSASASRASSRARSARTPGDATVSPFGSVTTGSSGALPPPVPP